MTELSLTKRIRGVALAAALLALALVAVRSGAQVVETPVPFDSAGRVMSLTPLLAAQARLSPPQWPVLGDYREARLFRTGADSYVIVVTRRDLTVERYPSTYAGVVELQRLVGALPSQLSFRSDGRAKADFVRHQTLMGVFVYGPALAAAVSNDGAGAVSTYLLTAGGSFFAASQFARHTDITPEMYSLSAHMSLRGALAGGALTYSLGTSGDGNAAGVFLGGLGGTAVGVLVGRSWSGQEVVASRLGADVFALTSLGVVYMVRGDREQSAFLTRGEAALMTGAGVTGYLAGRAYGRGAAHNITPGDARSLWLMTALGVAAARIPSAGNDVSRGSRAAAMTGGGLAGLVAGEFLLARRFDLEDSDASVMGLGSGAGALVGLGVATIVDGGDRPRSRTLTWMTGGAAAGLFLSHYFLAPPLDGGSSVRLRTGSLDFNPGALALTAAGVPGRFPLLSLTF